MYSIGNYAEEEEGRAAVDAPAAGGEGFEKECPLPPSPDDGTSVASTSESMDPPSVVSKTNERNVRIVDANRPLRSSFLAIASPILLASSFVVFSYFVGHLLGYVLRDFFNVGV